MSTQTLAAMTETILHTIAGGGGDEDPQPPQYASNYHQNPQHIWDTFDIALGPQGDLEGLEGLVDLVDPVDPEDHMDLEEYPLLISFTSNPQQT